MTPTMIRSNIFVDIKTEKYIQNFSKQRSLKKSEAWEMAVKALQREQIKKEMSSYYQDPENQETEFLLAEENLISSNPL